MAGTFSRSPALLTKHLTVFDRAARNAKETLRRVGRDFLNRDNSSVQKRALNVEL